LLTRSTYILTRPPSETVVVTPSWAQKGGGGTFSPRNCALRYSARVDLWYYYYQTYGTLSLHGTSLVPRKLPNTVIANTESSPVSPYSNLVSRNSTGLLEPKTYTFK
jgi:hypothetical protein